MENGCNVDAARTVFSEPVRFSAPYYRVLFLKSGRLTVVTPQDEVLPGVDDVLLLQPELAYELRPACPSEAVVISFTRESFLHFCLPALHGCPLLSGFFLPDGKPDMDCILFFKAPESVRQLADGMLAEFAQRDRYYEPLILCNLMVLLLELSRSCRAEAAIAKAPGETAAQKLIDYLTEHFTDATLGSMAETFHYHPNTVAAMLKKSTGKTFSRLQLELRMLYAAQLLAATDLSTDEVARECGYSNVGNFYAKFHTYYGMTPGGYALGAKVRREDA